MSGGRRRTQCRRRSASRPRLVSSVLGWPLWHPAACSRARPAVSHLRIFDRVHERTDIAVEASRSLDHGWRRRAQVRSVEASAQTVLHPLGQPASPAHAACPRPKLRVADIEGHFPIWWRISAERLVFGSAARPRHLGSHSSAICIACTPGSSDWPVRRGPAQRKRAATVGRIITQCACTVPQRCGIVFRSSQPTRHHGNAHKIACNPRQPREYVGRILPPFLQAFAPMSKPKIRVSGVIRPMASATRHAIADVDTRRATSRRLMSCRVLPSTTRAPAAAGRCGTASPTRFAPRRRPTRPCVPLCTL